MRNILRIFSGFVIEAMNLQTLLTEHALLKSILVDADLRAVVEARCLTQTGAFLGAVTDLVNNFKLIFDERDSQTYPAGLAEIESALNELRNSGQLPPRAEVQRIVELAATLIVESEARLKTTA